jgi:hypothetical protein
MVMATVVPNPPRVVWESEVKETAGRVRIVEVERFAMSSPTVSRSYVLECAQYRDAMGEWVWDVASVDGHRGYAAIKVAVEALGSRCGRDGEKVEVDE